MTVLQARASFWIRAALTIALVFGLAPLAAAQTETGRITGTVADATGGMLPGATINLKSVGTGAMRTTVTDTSGQYVFANVPPGSYELTTDLSGFRPANVKVQVTVGGAVSVDLKLEIAGAAETVNVTAESRAVNTTNAEVATTINEMQIRELPTITRNVYDLVAVSGNVSADNASNRGTGYAINGQRSASTNILLDGSANNDEFTASVGQAVPLDSVQDPIEPCCQPVPLFCRHYISP